MSLQTVKTNKPVSWDGVIAALHQRFVPEPNSGCWLWIGHVDEKLGYGRFVVEGRRRVAHLVSYEALVGPVPAGLQLDHLCRVRSCVNPAHLEPVTQAVNIFRGEGISAINSRKTHCARGHAFSSENTVLKRGGKQRCCRTCRDARNALRPKKRGK